MATLLRIDDPQAGAPGGFALWALGFRPFYLLGALHAASSVLLWALQSAGWLAFAPIRGAAWHGHEMLFGFATAIVAGFLFTAVRNWTSQPTPTGRWLMAIAALWVLGRVLVLTPFEVAAAAANAAFPLAVAVGIGIPLVRARNRRNYFFIALLALLSGAVLALHLSGLGLLPAAGRGALRVGLDVMLFLVAVMAGRVVPMFTNNGVPGAQAVRRDGLERASLAAIPLLAVADLAGFGVGPVALAAAVLHASRLALWQPWKTGRTPLVWILHAAYAWIPVHLLLRALAAWGVAPESLAIHALTVGAIGGMTIGMMTRTARGHTGRLLKADRWEVAAFALVLAAAVVRVGGPLAAPGASLAWIVGSALLWSAGFGVYFVRYWPILTRARVDGRPG